MDPVPSLLGMFPPSITLRDLCFSGIKVKNWFPILELLKGGQEAAVHGEVLGVYSGEPFFTWNES